MFFSRFLVQWWFSEKAGRPVAPAVFWWISIVGALCGAFYTGHRGEEVLLLGYLVNGCIAARNLMLYREGARRVGPLPALLLAVGVWGLILWTKLGGADARAGFGQSDYVRPNEDIETHVSALYNRIGAPALSDLNIGFDMEGFDVKDA